MVRREVEGTVDRTFQDLLVMRGEEDNLVTVVITGPPACGKTQVCRKYASAIFKSRIREKGNPEEGLYLPVLLWKAGSAKELATSLHDSLKTIRNPEYLKHIPDVTVMHTTEQVYRHHLEDLLKEVLVALKDKYNRRPKSEETDEWLIVIDGASSYDDLKRLMPSLLSEGSTIQWGRGKLLIAVQERLPVEYQEYQYIAEIPLGPGMSLAESLEFLKASFPHDSEEELKNVAEQLFCIPLSLAVAVETMKMLRKDNASYTWQRHLEKNLLPSVDVEPSDPRHPRKLHCQYNHTLYQALKQAVQRFGVEGNNAHLFFFLGLCEEGTVPLPLLKKLAVFLHGDEEEGMEEALFVQFNEDIRHNSLGLILLEGDAGISVHHVLHVVLRDIARSRLEGLAQKDEQQFETRRTVSAIIKAFCAVYQSTEQQSQGHYLDTVQNKLRLLPHYIAVFQNCIQLYGYQDDAVPRFALYTAQLLQLRREGSKVQNILKTGITVTAAMREIDILAKVDLKSLYAKELVEANEFGPAIDLLHETIRHRKEQDKLLQEAIVRNPEPTRSELDQWRRNFKGLHGDLVAIGYAFKDRGEEGDLAVAEEHVAEVFELLQRGRTEMAVYGGLDWGLMRSETLHLQAQLYQDIQRYDPSLLDELLRMSEDCVPASHHKCQVLRTLTDLLLEDGPQHDVDRAGLLIDRAIDMGHELYGEVHPMLAYSKMTKGRVFLEMENYEAALKLLAEALSLNDMLPVEVSGNTIVPLVHYFQGRCYIQQGRYKEAYDILKESAKLTQMSKDGFGPHHPQNTYVMDRLGQVCMHLRKLEEAKQYLEQSLCMKVRIQGKSHPELNWSYLQLETVAYECNDDDEALRFRAKRLKIASEDAGCDDCT